METKLSTALIAELIGTFALVFIGAGAGALGIGGLVGVAFAHGLTLACFAYAYGHVSGTHVNPAVTFGVLLAGRIAPARAAAYIVAQLAGGALAGYALAYCLGGTATGLGATVLAQPLELPGGVSIFVTPAMGVVIELVLTFFLVNTVLNAGVSGKAGSMAGLAIGLTLAFCILMGGPLTGGSVNPARTIGPALATGNWSDLWVYIVGPLGGGAVAALLYRGVLEE
jgi:aquaporin Z